MVLPGDVIKSTVHGGSAHLPELFWAPWLRSDGNACATATATAISLTALVCFERVILVSSIFYDDDDVHLRVCVSMCVLVIAPYWYWCFGTYQNTRSTSEVRTFLGSECYRFEAPSQTVGKIGKIEMNEYIRGIH